MTDADKDPIISAAEALIELGRYDAARVQLEKALDRSGAYFHSLLAYCFYKEEKYHEAIDLFTDAINIKNDMPNALFLRGHCYLEVGRFDEARRDYESVIELDPNTFDAYVGLGVLDESVGRPDEAINNYRRALMINSESSVAKSRLKALSQA